MPSNEPKRDSIQHTADESPARDANQEPMRSPLKVLLPIVLLLLAVIVFGALQD